MLAYLLSSWPYDANFFLVRIPLNFEPGCSMYNIYFLCCYLQVSIMLFCHEIFINIDPSRVILILDNTVNIPFSCLFADEGIGGGERPLFRSFGNVDMDLLG
jgi:hypothetical protein